MQYKTIIKLEEYIPLKIIFNEKDKEIVEYISYSKDKTSYLELAVGINSKEIKRITLLLCKDYSEYPQNLEVNHSENTKLNINKGNYECSLFKTILYSNGVKIVVSEKKSSKYLKMDKVYLGISDLNEIAEICVCDMSKSELNHLKRELQ